jgi:hypothetical protein
VFGRCALNQVFFAAVELEAVMQTFNSELIKTMRTALEDAMTKVPLEQATPGLKAYLAECILKAAAEGHTSYESLMAVACRTCQLLPGEHRENGG